MGKTWIIDIQHYGSDPVSLFELPAPARRLAEYFGSIIQAASIASPGVVVKTALSCRRRPGRRPCPGHIMVRLLEVPPEIEWQCSQCDDNGIIRNWAGTAWDLSEYSTGAAGDEGRSLLKVFLTREEYRVLQAGGVAFDRYCDRIIYSAEITDRGVMIVGGYDDMDYFLDCVAAEANHEENRSRRQLLESIYDRVVDGLDEAS